MLKLKDVVPNPRVTVAQLFDSRWGEGIWANDPVAGGGNVLSQGCHCFDATCFLNAADVVSVFAEGGNYHHPKLPITDAVACTLRFADGAMANVTIGDVGWPALLGKSAYQVFVGDVAATVFNYYSEPEIRLWRREPERLTMRDLPGCEDYDFAHVYIQQMRGFIDWVRSDETPAGVALIGDGVRATTLAVKASESARIHQPQDV